MIRHSGPISGVAWGGGRVATAGYDNQIILWEAGRARSRALHDHLANQCRFSPCGRFLVSASSDHSARVWSTPDLKLVSVLNGHDDDVEMAVFDPTGHRVATASRDHSVRIFDRAGPLRLQLEGHDADVISVEWSADGRQLISSSDDGTVRRWCAQTGRPIETIDLGDVEADTVVQVGEALCVGTDAGQIIRLDGHGPRHFSAHAAGVKRLVYDPPSGMLLSAGYDRAVRCWRVGSDGDLELAAEAIAPPAVWLRSLAFADHGDLLFGTFGGGYARCDASLSRWNMELAAATDAINAVLVRKEAHWTVGDAGIVRRDGDAVRDLGSLCNFLVGVGDRLLTGGHLGIVYDALTGEPLYQHGAPLNCATVLPLAQGHRVFIGSYTGYAIIIDERDGALSEGKAIKLHSNAVKGLACNREHLFSVCATGAAAFHALPALSEGHVISHAHDKISNGAAVLSDGRFASISRDRQLRLWSGARATVIPTPHSHSIKCVAACPITNLIATGAYNGLVALFDPHDKSWPLVVRPTASGISSLAHAGRPGAFIAASYDGRLYPVSAPSASGGNEPPVDREATIREPVA